MEADFNPAVNVVHAHRDGGLAGLFDVIGRMGDSGQRGLSAGACDFQEEDRYAADMEDFAFDSLPHRQILQHGLRIGLDFRRDGLFHQRADDFDGILRRQMLRVQNHLVGGRIGPFRIEEITVETRAVMIDAQKMASFEFIFVSEYHAASGPIW